MFLEFYSLNTYQFYLSGKKKLGYGLLNLKYKEFWSFYVQFGENSLTMTRFDQKVPNLKNWQKLNLNKQNVL